MKKAGLTQNQLAAEISVHSSTVGANFLAPRGDAAIARSRLTRKRKSEKARKRILPQTWKLVETYLVEQQWSSEQISGFLKLYAEGSLSAEQIYQHTYANKNRAAHFICTFACKRNAANAMANCLTVDKFRTAVVLNCVR